MPKVCKFRTAMQIFPYNNPQERIHSQNVKHSFHRINNNFRKDKFGITEIMVRVVIGHNSQKSDNFLENYRNSLT